jgi:hypothetical protein
MLLAGVAGCLGNGSVWGRGGSAMNGFGFERLDAPPGVQVLPFARQIVWGCGAAAVGTMGASVLPL